MRISANVILRVGLAFVFIYPAISAFINPLAWIGFFPGFVKTLLPEATLLLLYGVFQIALGVWILSGKFPFYSGMVAAALLVGIVFFNIGQIDLVFRDIGLAAAAIALAISGRNAVQKQSDTQESAEPNAL